MSSYKRDRDGEIDDVISKLQNMSDEEFRRLVETIKKEESEKLERNIDRNNKRFRDLRKKHKEKEGCNIM